MEDAIDSRVGSETMSELSAGRKRLSLFKKRNSRGDRPTIPTRRLSSSDGKETEAVEQMRNGREKEDEGQYSAREEQKDEHDYEDENEDNSMVDVTRAEQMRMIQEQRPSSQAALAASKREKYLLKVTVVAARNITVGGMLTSVDGACDTYVRIKTKNVVRTTSIKKAAKNPEWYEHVVLSKFGRDREGGRETLTMCLNISFPPANRCGGARYSRHRAA